jgi:hypothetical protein
LLLELLHDGMRIRAVGATLTGIVLKQNYTIRLYRRHFDETVLFIYIVASYGCHAESYAGKNYSI